MRAHRGFTLLEMMVVLAITAILAGIVVYQGRAARQNANLAGGAYMLALRIGGLKARAMSEGREHVLVIADTASPEDCKQREESCGRILVLRDPVPTFRDVFLSSYNPDPPITGGEYLDELGAAFLPRNTRFDLASTWRPPPPFNGVTAWNPSVVATCSGGRRCFAIRFRPNGDVLPVVPDGAAIPAGFAFVVRPHDLGPGGASRRGIFVSFPAGLVRTAEL
jgi:prepilin-type N-terminal cleavage/methylation domain-containing protein